MTELNRNLSTTEKLNMSSYDVTGRNFIAGLFATREQASNAINALKRANFTDKQIGVIVRDKNEHGALLDETHVEDHSGAAAGAVGGTLLGGMVGLLLGTGAMLIPGVGPVVAGGVLAETLGVTALGAGIGAASGSLLGSLADTGMSEDEARYFESGFKTGQILVTVKSDERLDEALEIIVRNGGEVGNYYKSSRQVNNNVRDIHNDNIESRNNYSDQANRTIQLKEEELNIQKQNQKVGEVVVNKRVVEEQKTVEVPIIREEIIIERHKVNEIVKDGSHITGTGQSQEIRVPLMEEQVNVNKQTFVTEEINVGKKQVHDKEIVSETLKKEEAYIQNKGDVRISDDLK